MKTSQAWWAATKSDSKALEQWLRDQYRGEATAGPRIEALRDAFAEEGSRAWRVLTVIATQERKHASWVAELLRARGLAVGVEDKADRYWARVVPAIGDLATGAAVGAHAEAMRLERIEAIASDGAAASSSLADVVGVFRRILPEERFHERAFRALAGSEALARTRGAHALGREALGLAP
jgi:rubrerythrin